MIGRTVSHYRIIEKLGEGGMGVVYKAEDTALQRTVALKFLPPDLTRDADAKQRFLHEARAAARLDHPNICAVYEVGESDGQLFLAMACYEGMTLREKLKAGPLPWAEAAALAMQAAAGLSEAHAHGIVHRDIKPANLFLTSKGQVKILDFGLAKLAGASMLTQTGTTVGTAHYMSPEQARGEAVDARSDLWSLGVVLYELVAGRPPFRGEYAQAVIYGILNEAPPPLAELAPGAPAALRGVVAKCLAKDPAARPAAAWELADALAGCLGLEAPTAPVSYKAPRPWWRRWPAAAAALAVLLAVAGIVAWRSGWGPFAASERAVRLAVLPLANLSGDPEQEYLSDGLTQELINKLGRLHPAGLSVIARTSIMQYKKSDKTVEQIGRELGVDYILEGSAQREGSRIRITAELIRVGDQAQLWADGFEREMAGVLALQSDVAKKVAGALALRLLPSEQARLASAKTVDPELYDLCLKGRDQLGRFSKAGFDAAEQYYQRALAKDPASAEAYAGMAAVWLYRRQLSMAPAREAGEKGRAAALKAVELDDTLAVAHWILGALFGWTDFNFAAAEREFKRTLELDPNDAQARASYSHALMILGRPGEGMSQIERAVAIDPLDVGVRVFYGVILYSARRYDEAVAQANEVLRLQPGHPGALGILYTALFMKHRYADAIKAQAAYYKAWGWPDVADALTKGYAESGYAVALRRATEVALATHGGEPGVAYEAAWNYTMAGDRARALDWLERAYADGNPSIPYNGVDPNFAPLRNEPRFQALLRKMNLPVDGTK